MCWMMLTGLRNGSRGAISIVRRRVPNQARRNTLAESEGRLVGFCRVMDAVACPGHTL